jgi:hypothetical protein
MLFLTQIPWRLTIASSRHQGVQFVLILQEEGGNDRRHPLTGTTESYQAQG